MAMSNLPIYVSPAKAKEDNLVHLADIFRMLGRKRGTVHMWIKRRHTTKFPMPKAVLKFGNQRWIELFDQTEVIDWYAAWIPSKGGAPVGNRNWVPKSQKTTS